MTKDQFCPATVGSFGADDAGVHQDAVDPPATLVPGPSNEVGRIWTKQAYRFNERAGRLTEEDRPPGVRRAVGPAAAAPFWTA